MQNNDPLTLKERRLRLTILRLSLLAAVTVTLSLPLVYLSVGYRYLQGSLETEAAITADIVEALVAENPDYWRYQTIRLEELLSRRNQEKKAGRRILDLAGGEVVHNVSPQLRPVLTALAPIRDAGVTVANVELSQSLLPLLLRTALAGLAGLCLGSLVFVLLKLVPMRALNEAQQELRENERKYHALFSSMSQTVLIVELEGGMVVVDANEAAGKLIGLPWRQVVGMSVAELFGGSAGELQQAIQRADQASGPITLEVEWERLDKLVKVMVLPAEGGQAAILCEDVTEQRRDEQRVQQLAYYDTLTGLPNRSLLFDRIRQGMARSERTGSRLAILFLDLDGFKPINDTWGHEAGDRILEQVAERLLAGTRSADTVARFAGDEFVVVVGDLQEIKFAEVVGEAILKRMSAPFKVAGQDVNCGCSIGISIYPDEGLDGDTLIRHADLAMYTAKEQGGNRCCVYAYLLNNPAAVPQSIPVR